LTSEETERA